MRNRVLCGMVIASICLSITACGSTPKQNNSLHICVDGAAYYDMDTVASSFMKENPGVDVVIDVLPKVKIDVKDNYSIQVDTDSLSEREGVLQQNRTALMAGSSDYDLYLLTGGTSQFHEYNGGTLIQDPSDLVGNGILKDLSSILGRLNREDYMQGIFDAGSTDDGLFLVPLRVDVSGIGVDLADAPAFPETREEFLLHVKENYPDEICNLSALFPLQSLSYSVVNKAAHEVYLSDDNYGNSIEWAKTYQELVHQFPRQYWDVNEQIENGTLFAGSSALLTFSMIADVMKRNETRANLAILPVPDEKGGVTVEAVAYGFVPANAKNADAAASFLEYMLSREAQDGSIPAYAFSGGGYPVRKNCAKAMLDNSMFGYTEEYVGQEALQSLTDYENAVTGVKYSNRYDFELLQSLKDWELGSVDDLDRTLYELEQHWILYLDE